MSPNDTGHLGPVEVFFYWPEAVFGNFYWPWAIGSPLASSPVYVQMLSRVLPVYSYFISSHCLVLFRRGKTPRKTPRKARGPTDPVEVSTGHSGGSKNCCSCIHLQLKPMRLFRFHCSDKFSLMLFKIWVSSSATFCRAGENKRATCKNSDICGTLV